VLTRKQTLALIFGLFTILLLSVSVVAASHDGDDNFFETIWNNILTFFSGGGITGFQIIGGGFTEIVSLDNSGNQGNDGESGSPSISGDGRFVAFVTENVLDPVHTNGQRVVYVRDRLTSTTELISVSTGGAISTGGNLNPEISENGNAVVFRGNGQNFDPRAVGFSNIFVRDRSAGTTELINVNSTGGLLSAPTIIRSTSFSISGDGNLVSFAANDLITGKIFVRDRSAGTTTVNIVAFPVLETRMSEDGNVIAYQTSGSAVRVFDLTTSADERVDVSSTGDPGNGPSSLQRISKEGRFVSFTSSANNLVPGDTNGIEDVFVRDRLLGITERVTVSTTGAQANGGSGGNAISGDGRFVIFSSAATNLVPGDTNAQTDLFIRDRLTGSTNTIRVVLDSCAQASNGIGSELDISADGNFITFVANNGIVGSQLVPGDNNGQGNC